MHIAGFLKVNEFGYVILFGKPLYVVSPVLMDTSHEVVGHAHVHDPVVPIGEEVDVVAVVSH